MLFGRDCYDRADTPEGHLSSYDDKVMSAPPVAAETTATGWRERMFVPTLVIVGLAVSIMSSLGTPLIPTIAAAQHVSLSTASGC